MSKRRTHERSELLKLIEAMKTNYEHLSAEEIYFRLKKSLPALSLSTVYRNLERFLKDGIVNKLEYPDGPAKYDANTEPHYHIRCVICGKLVDVSTKPEINFNEEEIKKTGFEIINIRVDFYGICPTCQKNRKQDNK